MMPLGQFRDTFIIAVDADGIAIIDQHVAHERVLFERVMEKLSSGRLESQRLLEPMLVELSPEGRQALLTHADDLDRLGFGVDDFGGETLRVTAVPAVLAGESRCDRHTCPCRGPGRARPGQGSGRCPAPYCGDNGVPRGCEGQLPADA